MKIIPPRATRRPLTSTHHGIVRVDDYAWLRASNWQAVMRNPAVLDADIRAQLEAENAYTSGIMAHTEELQQLLFSEMKARIKEDDASVPAPDGRIFLLHALRHRRAASPRLPRSRGPAAKSNSSSTAMRSLKTTPISALPMSRTARTTSSSPTRSISKARSSLRSKSSRPGPARLPDTRIADTNASFEWASDSRTLLYVWVDDEHRPRKVLSHAIGTEGQDALIHEQPDPGYFLGLGHTQSRRFLLHRRARSRDHRGAA